MMAHNLYYDHEKYKLYLGDSLDLLKTFPNEYFDLIFADPPYFLSDGSFTCQNGKKISVKKGNWDIKETLEDKIHFHKSWLTECKRVLKSSGTIWVSGTYHSIYQCGFIMQQLNFRTLNDIIWYKPNASPNLSCRMFTASHEHLIWARKNKSVPHYFNYELSKTFISENDTLKQPNKQMRSVWCIQSTNKKEKTYGKHPTQKPLELLNRIILTSSKENDIILDPFNGSGTTGVISIANNRRYVGIDINKEFLNLTIKRITAYKAHNV